MSEEEAVGDSERSAALDGWVAAFDREMDQNGDFATSIAAMTAHGCFDVRAVAERWILANPTGGAPVVQPQAELPEPVQLRLVRAEEPVVEEPAVLPDPAVETLHDSRVPAGESSPDIAYFRNLLHGGIEREQIDEAFPGFRLVIDEAVSQHETAAGPILSDVPRPPSREDLNDEIRGMRQKLEESAKRGRRRWRSRG